MEEKEKSGREYCISFLKKKLELPISWAWNGISMEEHLGYRKVLEEVSE